jgi:uncharacterized protein with HEPN domain
MSRDDAALLDIAAAARAILVFIQDLREDEFLKDLKTRSAVLYQIIVIGEATKRLSFEMRHQHPEIPWSSIAGMRDRLVHGYDVVDWREVWRTARADVPELLSKLEGFLTEENRG